MSDTNTPQVEDEWDDEDDPVPAPLRVFASPELDRDQTTARRAAGLIQSVHRSIVDDFCALEYMERALGEAEPVSSRAHKARTEIQRAIAGLDEVLGGTGNARDALVFHWKTA